MNFCINCVEITGFNSLRRNNSLYKNILHKESPRFFFNDYYHHDQHGELKINDNSLQKKNPNFFSKRVNIQAIVGKNGSGKSTLMDVVYAAINNFAFSVVRGQDKADEEFLLYIPELWLDVHFCMDISEDPNVETFKNFLLKCQDNEVLFGEEIEGSFKLLNHYTLDYEKNLFYVNQEDFDYKNLSKNFFYTIVSNYSMQSFISSNYITNAYRISEKKEKSSFVIENITDAWIDKIFHKNDSYLRPIVINPFRGGGVVDLNNESNLSKDRLTAILIYAKQQESKATAEKINLKYRYRNLKVSFNKKFLPQKLNKMYFNSRNIFTSSEDVIHSIEPILLNDFFCEVFERQFHYRLKFETNLVRRAACAYLLFKLFWISEKYAHYSQFRGTFIFDKDSHILEVVAEKQIQGLLAQISTDFSHVTKKFWRTLNFLYSNSQNIKSFNGYAEKLYVFYNERKGKDYLAYTPFYHNLLNEKHDGHSFISPVDIDFALPPSVFDYELILDKNMETIRYRDLSSGELQLLQTLSIHTYHIQNLISIIEGNSTSCNKYTNINLVFDEVEICFHPKQQQKFIQYLLDWFNMLRIAKDVPKSPLATKSYKPVSLNIFILTHSPFILSDIPSCNIMYMHDGKFANRDQRQTYAANVNQLLYDSFFLGDGYTGDFARNKITGLIYHLTNDKCCISKQEDEIRINENSKEWNEEDIRSFISNYIGDDILKRSLFKLTDIKKETEK